MSTEPFCRLAAWDIDRELIRRIRHQVFVVEQNVDPELEWDGKDAASVHALAGPSAEKIVATGRLQSDGKIGRMAVLPAWRGRGLGDAILRQLIDAARRDGRADVYLHAQTHALPFYARHGFAAQGPEFDEAGIPHRLMRRKLSADEMTDDGVTRLSNPDDYATAVIALLDDATRSVDVFSPDLRPAVFGSALMIEAVQRFATRSRHTAMRVLVRDTAPLTRSDHRFRTIAQRLSSHVQVRALAPDFHSRDDAFVVADELRYAVRRQASGWDGLCDASRPGEARRLADAFAEMWAHSLPEPGVRRLHL